MVSKRFQQTDFWCDFKCAHGWNKTAEGGINVLTRTFRLGFLKFSLAYIPYAPEVESDIDSYVASLKDYSQKIKPLLPANTLCIRYDVPFDGASIEERDGFIQNALKTAKTKGLKLKKTSVDVQPPDSTYLDLSKTEDEILAGMKNKWRYNLRYAQKHGVTVRAVTGASADFEKDLNSFYELYKTTASRDGIGLHPLSYYKDLMERGAPDSTKAEKPLVTLYIASHEETDLAAIITLFTKDEAIYLYGCSSNEKRNLMPAYLVQWTAICDAKKFDSKIYDFYGIPPTNDEGHPMHGLYLFKTGFGGKLVHRPGTFDVPLSAMYGFYTMAEKLRAVYHKKFLKIIRGR